MNVPVAGAPRTTSGRGPLALLVVGGLVIVAVAALIVEWQGEPAGGVEHRYAIPLGTGAQIDGGEYVAIVPSELHLAQGDTLTIDNADDRPHDIGVMRVETGETRSYTFPSKGTFKGACTLHSGGGVTIYVE